MKTCHIIKENYPTTIKIIKGDEYSDAQVIIKSWYFSVCDWVGNELEGFYDENEMLEYLEDMDDEETEDIQVFAYPQENGESVEKHELVGMAGGMPVSQTTIVREKYVFPNW